MSSKSLALGTIGVSKDVTLARPKKGGYSASDSVPAFLLFMPNLIRQAVINPLGSDPRSLFH